MPRKLPENIQWRGNGSVLRSKFPYLGFTTCGRWYIRRPSVNRGRWVALRGEHPTSLDGATVMAKSLGDLSDMLSRYKESV